MHNSDIVLEVWWFWRVDWDGLDVWNITIEWDKNFLLYTTEICYLATTFRCPLDILITFWQFTAQRSSGGQFSPSVWPHNPATLFQPFSATVVSAKPFLHGTGTLQKEMATYRCWSVSLWRDPDDVPHCWIRSPDKTEWWLISATLCRWGRCFIADQLWSMTRIREEEVEHMRSRAPLSCKQLTRHDQDVQRTSKRCRQITYFSCLE